VAAVLAEMEEAGFLGRGLAVAYESNPLVRWMFADDLSGARLGGLFTALVELGIRAGLVYRSEQGDGSAIWFPPIRSDNSGLDVAAGTSEWSSDRRGKALAVLSAGRPAQPHFYLDAVGVAPGQRRRGVASELLAPVLAVCDADRVPAYLENSDTENTTFYNQHGFEAVGPLPMPQGAPEVVAMWRTPRPLN
jgi:GNAT superfamily N-acetyltransferase